MTMALCLYCGDTKFGALIPCPNCKADSTGNMNLDIAFSEHPMSVATIEAFGEVVRAIRRVCEDDEMRFWAFASYRSIIATSLASRCRLNEPPRATSCWIVLRRRRSPLRSPSKLGFCAIVKSAAAKKR